MAENHFKGHKFGRLRDIQAIAQRSMEKWYNPEAFISEWCEFCAEYLSILKHQIGDEEVERI